MHEKWVYIIPRTWKWEKSCTCIFYVYPKVKSKNQTLVWTRVIFEFRAFLTNCKQVTVLFILEVLMECTKVSFFTFSSVFTANGTPLQSIRKHHLEFSRKTRHESWTVMFFFYFGWKIWFLRTICTHCVLSASLPHSYSRTSSRILIWFMSNKNCRELHWFENFISRKKLNKTGLTILPWCGRGLSVSIEISSS